MIVKWVLLLLMGFSWVLPGLGKPGTELPGGVSAQNPLVIDPEGKRVFLAAEINREFFKETSSHCGIGSVMGKNKNLFLFRTKANQNDFHQALVTIGLKPGNNLTPETPSTAIVQGDRVDLKITWNGAGKEYPLSQVVVDKSDPKKGLEIRFGGNQKTAQTMNTGCITCFTSCYAGITSNARYSLQDMEKGRSQFALNPEVLPPQGTTVALIFKPHVK